ncbi:MAG: dihydrofolate reductase [Bacilli bacterium]|nr:dihydrofolate reductase [Bacilli bacterium]
MISIIAAIGKNNELGVNNNLIWHIPEDLKYFKETTMNKTIVMGYKTYNSLPGLLPGRKHVVLTHHIIDNKDVVVFDDLERLIKYLNNISEEVFIIGGASLYKEFIDEASRLYLTEIDEEYKDADVYFPIFNKDNYKRKVLRKSKYKDLNYNFVIYDKEKNNER